MKLSAWAKSQGISYRTAWRLWKTGRLPVPVTQLATGTLVVQAPSASTGSEGVALYARVSSNDQKGDLDRQLARLMEYAIGQRWAVVDAVREIGSGLNGHRKGLLKLLAGNAKVIVVEHRDRLMRFGFEFVEAALLAQGRRIVVIDTAELSDDVVRDLHEVIVSMCARLYGKRSAEHRAKKALAVLHEQA